LGLTYTADDVLGIAEHIERNGAAFYRAAAELDLEPAIRQRLLDLAEMEDAHERTFSEMRCALNAGEAASEFFDPNDQATHYLQVMAGSYIFKEAMSPEKLVAGKSAEEIFETAIGLERESIAFYVGIRESVGRDEGKARVMEIIREEMGHAAQLTEDLLRLRGAPGS